MRPDRGFKCTCARADGAVDGDEPDDDDDKKDDDSESE